MSDTSADPTVRYCQRCSEAQRVLRTEGARPCHACGGVNFNLQPKVHGPYKLAPWFKNGRPCEHDRDFLRSYRIDPEND